MSNYKLYIELPSDGLEKEMEVNENSTVESVKLQLEKLFNIPYSKQVLIFKGEILNNEILINKYGIKNNSKLFLEKDEAKDNQIIVGKKKLPTNRELNKYTKNPKKDEIDNFKEEQIQNFQMIGFSPKYTEEMLLNPLMYEIYKNMCSDPYSYYNFINTTVFKKTMEYLGLNFQNYNQIKLLFETQEFQTFKEKIFALFENSKEDAKIKYKKELEILSNMGFKDEENNITLLRKNGGSIERVLNILFEQ